MQKIEKNLPSKPFPIPPSIVFAKINPQTGTPVNPEDPEGKVECFKKGHFSLRNILSTEEKRVLTETIYKRRDF